MTTKVYALTRPEVKRIAGEVALLLNHSSTRAALTAVVGGSLSEFRLGACFPMWFVDPPAIVDAPLDRSLADVARVSARLHVQVHVNGIAAAYVRLTSIESRLSVAALTVSELAGRIDSAVRRRTKTKRSDAEVRLVVAPSVGIRALWYVPTSRPERSRLHIVAANDASGVVVGRSLGSRQFLQALRRVREARPPRRSTTTFGEST